MPRYEEHLEAIKKSAIGSNLKEVKAEAERTGWTIRVVKEDGKACVGTCDFNLARINVVVVDGKVTEVTGLG